jgi:hypothetical protein
VQLKSDRGRGTGVFGFCLIISDDDVDEHERYVRLEWSKWSLLWHIGSKYCCNIGTPA